ncbi:MAG: 2-oxo acid dehydrogenase subunit, partial [Clostridia bacterium]|nr:2-oxo acid dehydrogenase subunit [Clostridia bacterium]
MAEFVVMPKMGLTMTEGLLVNWKKAEGDIVNKGEVLFEVETDKLTNNYESTTSGVIRKIIIKEGTVKVLEPVAIMGTADEDISELLKQTGLSAPAVSESVESQKEDVKLTASLNPTSGGRVKISPRAKKVAQDMNVDYNLVAGTGAGGAITEDDIVKYSQQSKKKVSPTAEEVANQFGVDLSKIEKDSRIMKADVIKFKLDDNLVKYAEPQETRIPMTTMRKVIAKRMLESVQTSPTVTFNIKVDTTSMKQIKDDLKD